jgi:hypothetical protein
MAPDVATCGKLRHGEYYSRVTTQFSGCVPGPVVGREWIPHAQGEFAQRRDEGTIGG